MCPKSSGTFEKQAPGCQMERGKRESKIEDTDFNLKINELLYQFSFHRSRRNKNKNKIE